MLLIGQCSKRNAKTLVAPSSDHWALRKAMCGAHTAVLLYRCCCCCAPALTTTHRQLEEDEFDADEDEDADDDENEIEELEDNEDDDIAAAVGRDQGPVAASTPSGPAQQDRRTDSAVGTTDHQQVRERVCPAWWGAASPSVGDACGGHDGKRCLSTA